MCANLHLNWKAVKFQWQWNAKLGNGFGYVLSRGELRVLVERARGVLFRSHFLAEMTFAQTVSCGLGSLVLGLTPATVEFFRIFLVFGVFFFVPFGWVVCFVFGPSNLLVVILAISTTYLDCHSFLHVFKGRPCG